MCLAAVRCSSFCRLVQVYSAKVLSIAVAAEHADKEYLMIMTTYLGLALNSMPEARAPRG